MSIRNETADSLPEQRSCSARCSLRKPPDHGRGGADFPTEAELDDSPSVSRLVEPMTWEDFGGLCRLVRILDLGLKDQGPGPLQDRGLLIRRLSKNEDQRALFQI